MNEEIINRTLQVFLYTGGFVSFWQITKHMPKVFFNLLEYIIAIPLYSSWIILIAGLIEYILVGNFDITFSVVGCVCAVSFLSVVWMTLVCLSREWQGKQQYKFNLL